MKETLISYEAQGIKSACHPPCYGIIKEPDKQQYFFQHTQSKNTKKTFKR